jgi:hypothetical protein
VIALIGCLLVAVLPLPKRAEGLRIGFFSAAMAFVFAEAFRQRSRSAKSVVPEDAAPIAIPVTTAVEDQRATAIPIQADLPPVTDEERIDGMDLLTGFSILGYLRRSGQVTDTEFEAKKQDLLRRA